jgi:hypothetical protein
MRLLDAKFKYTPSTSTNITSTWRRFGFKPTTEAERTARQRRLQHPAGATMHTAAITPLAGKRKFSNVPTLRLTVKK